MGVRTIIGSCFVSMLFSFQALSDPLIRLKGNFLLENVKKEGASYLLTYLCTEALPQASGMESHEKAFAMNCTVKKTKVRVLIEQAQMDSLQRGYPHESWKKSVFLLNAFGSWLTPKESFQGDEVQLQDSHGKKLWLSSVRKEAPATNPSHVSTLKQHDARLDYLVL